jgi:hypothetical protein
MPSSGVISDQHRDAAKAIRIDEALSRILRNPSFSSSKQCQQLLRYLVEKSYEQDDQNLKERTIGIEVFGRRPDYNTGDDPIVRARVGEVRKRLAQYYQGDASKEEQVQLSIPQGSYRIVYKFLDDARAKVGASAVVPPGADESQETSTAVVPIDRFHGGTGKKRLFYGLGAASILLILAILLLPLTRLRMHSQTALDQFWTPLLRDSKRVLVYTGTNAVYTPTWNSSQQEQSQASALFLPPVTSETVLTSHEIHSVNNEFTTSGDLLASVRISDFLAVRRLNYELRMGDNMAVGDLRQSPSILIGGTNNRWTLELASSLPIAYVPGVGLQEKDGSHRSWSDELNADSTRGESYAVVARLLDPETGHPIIIIAGIRSLGTRLAGQFVTDPEAFKSFASVAPSNWPAKNVEIVVSTRVMKGDTGTPSVVAVRTW